MSKKKSITGNKKIIAIVISLLLIVLAASIFYMNGKNDDSSSNTTVSKTCTTYGGRAEEQCIEDYIGLSQQEAIDRAKQHGYIPQVAYVDCKSQGVLDIGGNVIYFEVKNGIVTGGFFGDGRGDATRRVSAC